MLSDLCYLQFWLLFGDADHCHRRFKQLLPCAQSGFFLSLFVCYKQFHSKAPKFDGATSRSADASPPIPPRPSSLPTTPSGLHQKIVSHYKARRQKEIQTDGSWEIAAEIVTIEAQSEVTNGITPSPHSIFPRCLVNHWCEEVCWLPWKVPTAWLQNKGVCRLLVIVHYI